MLPISSINANEIEEISIKKLETTLFKQIMQIHRIELHLFATALSELSQLKV